MMTGLRKAFAVAVAATLALSLGACAPEPKDEWANDNEESWQEQNPEGVEERNTELPASFPSDFVIPEGAVIYDTGERDSDSWFLVLSAESDGRADELWQQVIAEGDFTVRDEEQTVEGGVSATLASPTLEVQALLIRQDDGSTLLNYDILGF